MENKPILETPFVEPNFTLAFLSILILTIGLFLTALLQEYIPFLFGHYTVLIFTLYFFIKRINYEDIKIGELFLWSTFIIFGGYLISNIIQHFFLEEAIYSGAEFLAFSLGVLFRSIIFGNTLSLGVFHLIKNKSWAMLILMIITSWMFQTLLIFDPGMLGG